MSRFFLLTLDEQNEIDAWLRTLPANAELVKEWRADDSDVPMLLFSAPMPEPFPPTPGEKAVEATSFAAPAEVAPVNPGWYVGQRVKAIGGKPHLVGLVGEVRAYFPDENSDDNDAVYPGGRRNAPPSAKMDGRPFPQLVVKFDGNRRRVRYSGAEDLLKLEVVPA